MNLFSLIVSKQPISVRVIHWIVSILVIHMQHNMTDIFVTMHCSLKWPGKLKKNAYKQSSRQLTNLSKRLIKTVSSWK